MRTGPGLLPRRRGAWGPRIGGGEWGGGGQVVCGGEGPGVKGRDGERRSKGWEGRDWEGERSEGKGLGRVRKGRERKWTKGEE